jgi:hypothetical protein
MLKSSQLRFPLCAATSGNGDVNRKQSGEWLSGESSKTGTPLLIFGENMRDDPGLSGKLGFWKRTARQGPTRQVLRRAQHPERSRGTRGRLRALPPPRPDTLDRFEFRAVLPGLRSGAVNTRLLVLCFCESTAQRALPGRIRGYVKEQSFWVVGRHATARAGQRNMDRQPSAVAKPMADRDAVSRCKPPPTNARMAQEQRSFKEFQFCWGH